MDLQAFLKTHKINKIYKYVQVQKEDTIEYGWIETDKLDLNDSVVISYHSKTKRATPEQVEWSKKEKNSATSLLDYRKYFKAMTGQTPEVLLEKWGDSPKEFGLYWKDFSNNWKEDQDLFVMKLAKLITDGEKFVMYGRGFKVVQIRDTAGRDLAEK